MREILSIFILSLAITRVNAQDNCASAVNLCANTLLSRTTQGATADPSDPAISCGDNTVNNSVWFTVIGINNGNTTITVTNIDNNPGLEMEVYTGSCGSLVPLGICASGSSATGRQMSMTFPTNPGVTYYIMVDGTSGNQETFNIIANATNNSIVARPDANFSTNISYGCAPITADLYNTTVLYGGNNITYEWRINTGPYIPASGADTSITFNTAGVYNVTLRVCNTECGCKTVTQEIIVQDLFPSIIYNPVNSCTGVNINFSGAAVVLPDPPYINPNVTSWEWDFGDPASGASNTASGQNVSHTFSNTGTSFQVTLVVNGTCGPDTARTTINFRPPITASAGSDRDVCEGTPLVLAGTAPGSINPVTYNWTGPGTFSCNPCQSPSVTGLTPGGPYTYNLSVTDGGGCTATSSVNIIVNPRPSVSAGPDLTVCNYSTVALNATPSGGTPPYVAYNWTPTTGLSSATIQNPVASITGNVTYCVTVRDSLNCTSVPSCKFINVYPRPTISSSNPALCATDPNLQNTFTVNGAGPGSTYSWTTSPSYSLITSANADSSSITATFPSGVTGTYTFTTIVVDGVTSCRDTVTRIFNVVSGLNMSVSGPDVTCRGDSVTLTANGASTVTWTANPAYAFSNPNQATQIVAPMSTTVFTITGSVGSCSQMITDTLVVNPKPNIAASPIPTICGCGTVSLNGTGSTPGMIYSWTSASGGLITSPSSLVTSAARCSSDVFTLRVTDTSTNCFRDSSVTFTSIQIPAAVANVTPDIICNGTSTVVNLDGTGSNTAPGTTYHWSSNNPGTLITDTTAMVTTATISTSTVFYLRITDSFGCDSLVTDTVFIHPMPTITTNNPYLCTSDPVLESLISITGAAPSSVYTWTNVPACTSPNFANSDSQNFDFASCGAGTYVFDVEVTDGNTGCVTNLSQTITVVTGVTLVVSNDTTICEGGVVNLNASGANSYGWSNGATSASISLPSLTATGSPYSYTVTGTIGSCMASRTINVIVNPVPATTVIAGPSTVCRYDSLVIYNVNPVMGNYTWTINGGTITNGQNTNEVTVTWGTAGPGSLTVIDTNSFGCAGPLRTISVTVNPVPDSSLAINGPTTVCATDNVTYSVVSTAGSTYNWTVAGGNINGSPVGTSINVTWPSNGSGTVTVQEVNAVNCIGPIIQNNITINPRPAAPVASGIQLVCNNTTHDYSVPFTAGSTYNWIISGGNSNPSSNTDTNSVYWTTAGAMMVSVSETNLYGCTGDTTDHPVQVSGIPDAIITPDSAVVCQLSTILINGTAINGTVNWITNGGGTFNDPTLATPVYSPLPSDLGYYDLHMIVSNAPCPDDTAKIVMLVNPNPVVTVTGTQATICYGETDTLTATGGGTYMWTPGNYTTPVIMVTPTMLTTYVVAVTNSFNCTTLDSFTVAVNPAGVPYAGIDQLLCKNDNASLAGTQQGGGGFLWSTLGDGQFLPSVTDPMATYVPGTADTSSGSATLVLTTTGFCLNLTDTMILSIVDAPILDAGPDLIITSAPGYLSSIPLKPVLFNAPGVVWTTSGTGYFIPNNTTLNAKYVPSNEDYDLDSLVITASNTGGCMTVTDFFVIDFVPLVVPNVFTPYPGSPGLNDYFYIPNLPAGSRLKIFDRWGLVIFSSNDYLNNWDAEGLKSDIYYYVLESGNREYKGWVQVLFE
ncbi:MAG: PKD domain-containing protein [Bacteroidetes bacterium]|nr:MAG: PKD domain-containing protein [Bacteroidota bacterium]REK34502.1 MAG: PKD domain-containing protein [Bacteroidota bacterium]REK50380.1 MAG: PKD domain-containing protein [Bacteroidota bacterium]